MRSQRLGIVVLILAGAVWAQLALIPWLAMPGLERAADPFFLVASMIPLALAAVGVRLGSSRPSLAPTLVLAGFPALLGAVQLIARQRAPARFDPAAGVVAAATSLAFLWATIAWAQGLSAQFPVTVTALETVTKGAPPPKLRRLAPGLLGAMAVFLAIVAPAIVSARGAVTRAERLAGDPLVRGREAITAAGGLAIALWLLLDPGSALVRSQQPPTRRGTRGMAFLLWAFALFGLKILLDRLR